MTPKRERELLERIRTELDREARQLDELTVGRLGAARRRALDALPRRNRWWMATGVASAVTAAAVAVLMLAPAQLPTTTGLDQMEMLADADIDVYDNLEFYRWLAEQHRAG